MLDIEKIMLIHKPQCRVFYDGDKSTAVDSESRFYESRLDKGKFYIVKENAKTATKMFTATEQKHRHQGDLFFRIYYEAKSARGYDGHLRYVQFANVIHLFEKSQRFMIISAIC